MRKGKKVAEKLKKELEKLELNKKRKKRLWILDAEMVVKLLEFLVL